MTLPFPGDITATANGLLLLSLVAAIIYGLAQAREPSWRRSVAGTAAVGLLATLSFVEGGPLLLTAALALGAASDAALSLRGEHASRVGRAALLLARLAYVALFFTHWHGWGIAAGAALLVASDALAAARKFLLAPETAADPRLGWAAWGSRYLAQALITLALLI